MCIKKITSILFLLIAQCDLAYAQETTRARDLGIPFEGTPGVYNAITDVAGVEVGHTTITRGNGGLKTGQGPVRTGVTALHPRGKNSISPVFGGWFALNASGEMTGTSWLSERGLIDGPIMITNTHSVGVVRDATVAWMVEKGWSADWHAPVVAETYDGFLNDVNGFHVTKAHALSALENATSGPVIEGSVGGGTGMVCNLFKGGIGTASRIVETPDGPVTVGVLVQCNYGGRKSLRTIAGVDVRPIVKNAPKFCYTDETIAGKYAQFVPYCDDMTKHASDTARPDGSIIVVVATDAPLLPHQLNRLAKRPSLALGRLGSVVNAGSGDLFLAFSTAFDNSLHEDKVSPNLSMYANNKLTPLFEATVQATEEAILNAMIAADDMVGIDGLKVPELPEAELSKFFALPD